MTKEPKALKLTLAKAREEHARLQAEIAEHDRRYHGEDAPIISDADYDALRRRYTALEEAFPKLADADSANRKVVHVGAGTARSDDRRMYGQPEFNLLRLHDLSLDTNKFKVVTVYAFEWNGVIYSQKNAFERGTRAFKSFELRY